MRIESRRRFLNTIIATTSLVILNSASGSLYALDDENVRWGTLNVNELKALTGQSFNIYGLDTESFAESEGVDTSCAMTLDAVYASKIDPNRPDFLVRKQSFVAIFTPTWGYNCISTDQIVKISHPEVIGEEDIFLTSKTDEHGNPFLEVVFN